jgi:hypothetical protein
MKNVKIPVNPKKHITQEIEVILGVEIENDFDVVEESIPIGLPSNVDWVSNFSLKKKPQVQKMGIKKTYYIELEDRGKNLVYWDGRKVQPLKKVEIGERRVRAALTIDDPPVGWGN